MIVNRPAVLPRLLAGPPLEAGPEPWAAHLARLGPVPSAGPGDRVIAEIEASGLLGRGGAGFPVGRKWRAMAERRDGRAVVVANGAEGEPASAKDRVLMATRPHLVLDGALIAADAVGAEEIVVYVGREHAEAVEAMGRAMDARRSEAPVPMRLVRAPIGYVAGEATAAVHYINDADARPTTTPPRMSVRGVGGHPTLVQNVESLAHAALIARHGATWYRAAGRAATPGTALVTLTGPIGDQGVREIEHGTTLAELVAEAGGTREDVQAVILGGYFGTWARAEDAWDLPLDPAVLRERGLTLGCGIIGLLPADVCGVEVVAEIMSFLADESAGQCGPCLFGLRAIADAVGRVARGSTRPDDAASLRRWMAQVPGRGACRHPDGAVQMLATGLDVFADDVARHLAGSRCGPTGALPGVA